MVEEAVPAIVTVPVEEIANLVELFTWKFAKSPMKEEVTLMPMKVPEAEAFPKVEEPIWIKAEFELMPGEPVSDSAVPPARDTLRFVEDTEAKLLCPEMFKSPPWRKPDAVRLVEETFEEDTFEKLPETARIYPVRDSLVPEAFP